MIKENLIRIIRNTHDEKLIRALYNFTLGYLSGKARRA